MKMIPSIELLVRDGDKSPWGKDDEFNFGSKWKSLYTTEICTGKKVLLIGVGGAFCPTESLLQIPEYEDLFDEFKELGIDDIYFVFVNDSFVLDAYKKILGIKKVKFLPDGNAKLTTKLGMLKDRTDVNMGIRSKRYVAYVDNCSIVDIIEEENTGGDPYNATKPEKILEYLKR